MFLNCNIGVTGVDSVGEVLMVNELQTPLQILWLLKAVLALNCWMRIVLQMELLKAKKQMALGQTRGGLVGFWVLLVNMLVFLELGFMKIVPSGALRCVTCCK